MCLVGLAIVWAVSTSTSKARRHQRMAQQDKHSACVEAWMARTIPGLSRDQVLELFGRALDAVWRRAYYSLGEITLTAIVDRVLYTSADSFPGLAALKVESAGVNVDTLREAARSLPNGALEQSFRHLLVELLRILGVLTGEILTPALQTALDRVVAPPTAKGGNS